MSRSPLPELRTQLLRGKPLTAGYLRTLLGLVPADTVICLPEHDQILGGITYEQGTEAGIILLHPEMTEEDLNERETATFLRHAELLGRLAK